MGKNYRKSLPITVLCITDLRITDFFEISFLVYNWFYLLITDFVTTVNLVKSRRICSIYLKSRKSIGCGIGKRNVPIKRNNSSSALQAKNWVFACLDLCSATAQYLILKISHKWSLKWPISVRVLLDGLKAVRVAWPLNRKGDSVMK